MNPVAELMTLLPTITKNGGSFDCSALDKQSLEAFRHKLDESAEVLLISINGLATLMDVASSNAEVDDPMRMINDCALILKNLAGPLQLCEDIKMYASDECVRVARETREQRSMGAEAQKADRARLEKTAFTIAKIFEDERREQETHPGKLERENCAERDEPFKPGQPWGPVPTAFSAN